MVEDELRRLSEDLLLLKAWANESGSEKKSAFRKLMENWIRELVYDVEDTIDTFSTKTAAVKKKNFFTRLFRKYSMDIKAQVKCFRQERVNEILNEINLFEGKQIVSCSDHQPQVQVNKDKLIRQSKAVNMVDFEDEDTIIGYLKESKNNLEVITIVGMPGLGKSTLAWKIYHAKEVVEEFDVRIWINASQKFNRRNACLTIMEALNPKGKLGNIMEEQLVETVRSLLAAEKFLLVLDDVWRVQYWNEIEKLLPHENNRSKVLITSRQMDIGVHCNNMYKMKFLTSKTSWELLKLEVFGNICYPENLLGVGQELANQCGGVPLLIVVMGRILEKLFSDKLLHPMDIELQWNRVLENASDILQKDEDNLISNSVELSYNRLPDKLRECFLYTGMLIQDEVIRVSTLMQLWIGEGFIRPMIEESLEETAEKALQILINSNLLVVEKFHLGQVKTCRVHDMIRGFCRSKADEENLFQVVKNLNGEENTVPISWLRRICLHSDPYKFLSGKPRGPLVRSLVCFCKEASLIKEDHKKCIFRGFKLLRVINFNSAIKFDRFPKVKKLILLKHINLSIDNLKVIPKQISKLLHLQTLLVETNSPSVTMKANIWKMVKLRHVETKAAIFLDDKKWKVEADRNLQTLSSLSPESCRENLSAKASQLKMLGVRGELANRLDTMSLQNFSHLEKLKIKNYESEAKNPMFVLPRPNHFPSNLKKMTLSATYLQWDCDMHTLSRIRTLEVLKLKDNAFIGASWHALGVGFQRLQSLQVADTNLVTWEASDTYFPTLRWLVLRNCPEIEGIPDNLTKRLKKLELENVNSSVAASAKRIEAEKQLVELKQKSVWEMVPFELSIGPGCD